MRYFIEIVGVNIHVIRSDDGMTPLHAACVNPDHEVLAYLISQGAEINAKTDAGSTPLMVAVMLNPNVEVLACLISKGAEINAKSHRGLTALHIAAHNPISGVDVLKYLISKGANIDAEENNGGKPLDLASSEEKKTCLRDAKSKQESKECMTYCSGCLVIIVLFVLLIGSCVP